METVAEIEEMIIRGVGKSAANEKMAVIKVLSSRVYEERMLTNELHSQYISCSSDEDFAKRDSIMKRIESLSRIISSLWNQLSISGAGENDDFIDKLKGLGGN